VPRCRRACRQDAPRFAPSHQARERWEQVADARDREEFGELFRENIAGHGAVSLRVVQKLHEMKRGSIERSETCENSWGGTRTRDPGIMSRVEPEPHPTT
jgi:hypothetical protein